MRKRLRKKKHLGEFQEFGVEISATLKSGVDFGVFLDDFLCDPIEANGLAFGGGGGGTQFSGYVELGQKGVQIANLEKVTTWLSAETRIESYRVSKPVDVWYAAE